MEQTEDTGCFTYEVTMVVQVLATNRDLADEKLEKEGGFVSSRKVSFKTMTPVFVSSKEEE